MINRSLVRVDVSVDVIKERIFHFLRRELTNSVLRDTTSFVEDEQWRRTTDLVSPMSLLTIYFQLFDIQRS